MGDKKIFLLGIGGQKCGTTWLESQLAKTPFFDNGGVKEFHIFNKLHQKRISQKIIRRKKRGQADLLTRGEAMRLSPKLYFDHFDYLFHRNPNITHVGDITPAYSSLPATTFEQIRNGLAQKNFNIKVVFLMRDPVERVWSQLRMNNRLKAERQNKKKTSAQDEFKQLRRFYKSPLCKRRTRYELTAGNIESIFPTDAIYYGFYEQLFQQSEINRLTAFLECPPLHADFGKVVHASPKPTEQIQGMQELLQEIRSYYAETYEWTRQRFGDQVPSTWN